MFSAAFLMSNKVKGKTWCLSLKVGRAAGRVSTEHQYDHGAWSVVTSGTACKKVEPSKEKRYRYYLVLVFLDRAYLVWRTWPSQQVFSLPCSWSRGLLVLSVPVQTMQPTNGLFCPIMCAPLVVWCVARQPAPVTPYVPLQNNPTHMRVARVIPTKLCVSNKGGSVKIEYTNFRR